MLLLVIVCHSLISQMTKYYKYIFKLRVIDLQNLKMRKSQKATELDNLLYSASQYEDDDGESLRKQLTSAQDKFLQKRMLELDEDDDDDGVDLGNGASVRQDQNWEEDDNDQGRQWNRQQHSKFFFRQVAGNSQQFSQSLSIHRPDLLESKGMHDSSVNLQAISIQNFLSNKRKQQQKVNEVLNTQITDLVQKIQKQQCLIKGYKKKIEDLEEVVRNLKKQNQELDEWTKDYHINLSKKDEVFNKLRDQYMEMMSKIDQKQDRQKQLIQNQKSMQKQIDKLRLYLKNFTDQDKGLLDFRSLTPKRSETSSKSSTFSVRDAESLQIQVQKFKRERNSIEKELQFTKQDLLRKQEKLRALQDDYNRKNLQKERKISQLNNKQQQYKTEILKLKKNNDSNSSMLKEKTFKLEKELNLQVQKSKQFQTKIKLSIQEIKKKQEKIKQILTDLLDKNKKITQLKDSLQQEQAKNQIETKLQKERQNQIDKLQKQVKELKTQKFNMKRQLQNLQKPSNSEQKLKKQLQFVKSQKQKFEKQVIELNQQIASLQKQIEQKNQKLKEMKKKIDDMNKKSILIKRKSEDNDIIQQQVERYKDTITKMAREINQLKKKAETNQQMANKLYILQSRMQLNSQKSSDPIQIQNQYDIQQINEAYREQLELKDEQIQGMKQMHQREIQRMVKQIATLKQTIDRQQSELGFKQKSLDFIHGKFVQIEKQNAELKANRNILHSSFYDESYDHQNNQAIHFYENKVSDLEKKIQILSSQNKQKQNQMRKIYSQRQNSSFEINQLKQRIKDLQSMAIANEPARKIAPESFTHQQTIDFLIKTLKRTEKSSQMIRSLSKINDFRIMLMNILKTMERDLSKKQRQQR